MNNTKRKQITSYFQPQKKPDIQAQVTASIEDETVILEETNIEQEQPPPNSETIDEGIVSQTIDECIDFNSSIRDPGRRKQIESYDPNKKDLVRRAYIDLGPYQPILQVYPPSGPEHHPRRFQKSWFQKFPWLEYSPDKDAAYCFYCFLFAKKPLGRCGSDTFTIKGFNNWKKVNNGKIGYENSENKSS